MLSLSLASWWWLRDSPLDTSVSAPPAAVAVLRFESGASNFARQLADNISDELRSLLRDADVVAVTPRGAAVSLPADLSEQDIATRLGARYLVTGAVLEPDQTPKLSLRVADASAGATLWENEFDASTTNLLQLNNEIAEQVLNALHLPLGPARTRMSQGRTRNEAAYRLYLQALERTRRSSGAAEIAASADLLAQAIAMDAKFGDAHAALCRVHLAAYEQGRDAAQFEQAERACHRALTLDSKDEAVYIALGDLYRNSGQLAAAQVEFNKALSLDATAVDAYIGLGETLASAGDASGAEWALHEAVTRQPGYWQGFNALGTFFLKRGMLDEAIDAYSRMAYLVPDNPWAYNNLGGARFFAGDFEGALGDWRRANSLKPNRAALSNMGTAYFHLRRFDEAAEMYRQALAITPRDHRLWGNLGDVARLLPHRAAEARQAYARQIELAQQNLAINEADANALSRTGVSEAFMGDRDAAVAATERALRIAPDDMDVLYDASVTFVTLGEVDRAVDTLRRAIAAGYAKAQLTTDPLFDSLRAAPAYLQLVDAAT
jgi:tetratricopeptide (TPR) repeat protein